VNVLAHPTAPTARSIRFTTIGAICDQFGGEVQTGPFGSQLHASDYSAEGTPVVMPQDMVDGRIVTAKIARVSQEHVARLPQHRLQAGDIVYSRRGDVSRFAIVTEAEGGWLCGTGSIRIRLNSPDFDTRYLRRFLQQDSVRSWLENEAKGVTMLNLNTSIIRNLPIAFPPLAEQRRIAAILDQADALRAKRRAALAQLDEMARAIFVEMFGDHATNPRKLDVVRLDQVTDCLDYQRRPVKASDRAEGQIPYYGANGQQGWIDRPLFDEALVLVAEDGGHFEEPERGVAYRIDGPAWVNNHAHILRARKELLDTEYLHRALRHYNFAPYISGTTRAKLTQGQLNSAKVMLPPLPDQRRFSERIEAVEGLRQLGTTSALDLDNLFTSLQHRAFRGEL
jgi:restriction endonuclease S subunit